MSVSGKTTEKNHPEPSLGTWSELVRAPSAREHAGRTWLHSPSPAPEPFFLASPPGGRTRHISVKFKLPEATWENQDRMRGPKFKTIEPQDNQSPRRQEVKVSDWTERPVTR